MRSRRSRWSLKVSHTQTQAYPSKKDVFGHVTSLIGRNVTAAYSNIFPELLHTPAKFEKKSAQRSKSYKENKTRSLISTHIQTSVPLNNEYLRKLVLIKRKRNITGSVSFSRQIGFWFTLFYTVEDAGFF